MKICDRTWQRDGVPKPGPIQVVIEGAEIEEVYHLAATECEALREFINAPNNWQRKVPPPTKKSSETEG